MTEANRFRFRQIHRETGRVRICGFTKLGSDFGSISPMGSSDHWTDPEQSTGLTDKNGVEIFEGDVVQAAWGLGDPRQVVRLENFFWCKGECIISEDIEVIGNIHQNPELMEATAQ